MAAAQAGLVLEHLRKLLRGPGAGEAGDAELLGRFVARHDEAAFAELVRRHGPMVLGVCRRVLRHPEDAEDAFQATFLVLARKAGSLGRPELLGNYLYGVAYRTALAARGRDAKRRDHERRATNMRDTEPVAEADWAELRVVLDEELSRLPEKYRAPLVLCYLGGKTHRQAASALGMSAGSISWRLGRARELLRQRLVRRGVTLSAAALATALTGQAAFALVLPPLAAAAVRAGVLTATGQAAGAVSARAAALAECVVKGLSVNRWALTALLLLGLAAAGTRAGLLSRHAAATPLPAPPADTPPAAPQQAAPARADRYGDPLPAGAIARLGTVRFRAAHTINFLRWAADGATLVGSDWDNTAHVWDRATGKELHTLLLPEEWRGPVAVSADGKTLAAGGRDKDRRVRLWDLATGKLLFTSAPLAAAVEAIAFSPDGKTLAAAGAKVIRLWEVATGKELGKMPAAAGHFDSLTFSPDGKLVAAACHEDHAVHLWDLTTRRERPPLRGHRDFIYGLAFAPDGKTLVSTGADGDRTLRIWDVATGAERRRLPKSPGWVAPVALSPDGRTLALGSQNGKIALLDPATGKERLQLRIPGQDDTYGPWVMALAFSPDGKTLASSGTEHTFRFWDVATGRELPAPGGHTNSVRAVAFAPDGRLLATASEDRTIRFWDPATGAEVGRITGAEHDFFAACFAPDGKTLAAAGQWGVLHLWDVATRRELHRIDTQQGDVSSLAFSPDGKTLVSGGDRGPAALRVWDVASGKPLRQFGEVRDNVTAVAFAPDGKLLAAGLGYEYIALVDPVTGRERHSLRWHEGFARALSFSPDGRLLASAGGRGNALHLWEVASGQEVRQIPGSNRIINVAAFSPDGRLLASGGQDNTVRLWDVPTGRELCRFAGHRGRGNVGGVLSVAFSPDGRTLASSADDTTALVWDVRGALGQRQQPKGARLGPAELEALWQDLAAADAAPAQRAVWRLADGAGEAVPFLAERVRPVKAADPSRVARLLADLDSERFEVRAQARRRLEALGDAAAPALRDALDKRPSAEVRRQVESLLERLDGGAAEPLRQTRAVQALELAGTPEARQVLQALSRGMPEARLTEDARTARRRLEKQALPRP